MQESSLNLKDESSMMELLKLCNLDHKYGAVFQQQGITLDRFDRLSKLSSSTSLSQMIIEKCEMTCGDLIDLICTWEHYKSTLPRS